MLSCINLALEFGDTKVFSSFSMTLLPGSIYVLQGSNASGKTSLLKSIVGLHELSAGEVLWNNKSADLSNYISYLGHENAVKSNLTVLDNLELWADLKNTYPLVLPAIAQFKLIDVENVECKYLSSGMQKRVALARMIISNTKLWLLDEPEANLDEEGREFLLKLLQVKISSGGMAIIATHNLEYYKNIPIIKMSDFKHEQ